MLFLGCEMAAIGEQRDGIDRAAQLIDSPSTELSSALSYLALTFNIDLVYDSSLIKGRNAPRLGGYMTAREALTAVLRPSGLSVIETQPDSYLITQPSSTTPMSGGQNPSGAERSTQKRPAVANVAPFKEIVVVGTHLSNQVPIGASISTYDAQDLELAGGVSLDNLGRKMTENFSGADSLSTLNTNGNVGSLRQGAASNIFGGAGFNLLGLGPGATLTLLNGRRLAPA